VATSIQAMSLACWAFSLSSSLTAGTSAACAVILRPSTIAQASNAGSERLTGESSEDGTMRIQSRQARRMPPIERWEFDLT
jgi:hypothetical protein